MRMKRSFLTLALALAATLLISGSVQANTITFNTDDPGTGFGGSSLVLNNALGATATLTFAPEPDSENGVPSNINFGVFTLVCGTCSTQAQGAGSFFDAFSFDLVLTDVTNIATGKFVGTSAGGTVYADVSQIEIEWSPLQLGPGTTNAESGDFGTAIFTTTSFTGIVAPNSGDNPGQTTVQGFVADTAIPEPATLTLVGAMLLALGMMRRRLVSRG